MTRRYRFICSLLFAALLFSGCSGSPAKESGPVKSLTPPVPSKGASSENETDGGSGSAAASTLTERVTGRYAAPVPGSEGEFYVMDLYNAFGNLVAEAGTAMGPEEDPYSYWAMELIPAEPNGLLGTDPNEADIGIVRFSNMSNLGKYWGPPEKTRLILTDNGVSFFNEGEDGISPGSGPQIDFERTGDSAYSAENGSSAALYAEAFDDAAAEAIPESLLGLWKTADDSAPLFLEFRSAAAGIGDGNTGAFRIFRKQPGTEVLYGQGSFRFGSGTLQTAAAFIGTADMPHVWNGPVHFEGDDHLVLSSAPEEWGQKDLAGDGGELVFERAKEDEVPVTVLAEPDDAGAVRGMSPAAGLGRRSTIPQFLSSSDIENNGGHFLRIGNLIYFRDYSRGIGNVKPGTGNYLTDSAIGTGSVMCCYDKRTGETFAAYEDGGYGPLYYMDGRIYSAVYHPEAEDAENTPLQTIESCFPDGGGRQVISQGGSFASVNAVSEGRPLLCIREYSPSSCYLADGSFYPALSLPEKTADNMISVHFAEKSLLVLWEDEENAGYSVTEFKPDETDGGSYTYGDTGILLGTIPSDENHHFSAMPEVTQVFREGDDIYLGIGWYGGTAHVLNGYNVIRMRSGAEQSLTVVQDGSPAALISEPDPARNESAPYFICSGDGTLQFTSYDPEGEIALTDISSGDLVRFGGPFGAVRLIPDFIPSSPYSASAGQEVLLLQTAEYVDGAVYVITADAIYSPEFDIGWRMAFTPRTFFWRRIPMETVSVPNGEAYPQETLLEVSVER